MLGIVFSGFLTMAEDTFSEEVVDDIIRDANPETGGAYTSVGSYDYRELVALVAALSRRTGTPVPDLICSFGEYLFRIFQERYSWFIEPHKDLFSFLESVDEYIHVEVRKLYPNANPPQFSTNWVSDSTFQMTYQSHRCLAYLAQGLLNGAIDHFGGSYDVAMTGDTNTPNAKVCFTISTQHGQLDVH